MGDISKNQRLELPEKVIKKSKGYYLPKSTIKFIKDEATKLECSENDVLTAMVNYYKKAQET